MKNLIIHKAESRGQANHGWLVARHTFSFANYFNPERMNFGVLRVLNDDIIDPGMGFGMHPHDNMEIITIPLQGSLQHRDSMGNGTIITAGEVQVMSAGTGILHSEMNPDHRARVNLLQIWVMPDKRNVEPRYDQIKLNQAKQMNTLIQIITPNKEDEGIWIHQQAWFQLGKFSEGQHISYSPKRKGNGLYLFIISGSFKTENHSLTARDGMGVWNVDELGLIATENNSEILIMDVPME